VTSLARKFTALGAVFLAAVGIAACGGVPSDSVATVEGNPIKKTSFEHWVNVATTANAQSTGASPVPLVPPNFSACISHYEEVAAKGKNSKPPSTTQLKASCEAQYKAVKTEVMKFLTSAEWVIGEAKKLGVSVTDEQVHNEFLKIKNSQFPTTASFEKFLKSSGQTVSDLLLRVKINMLSQKIEKKVIAEAKGVSQSEVQKYYEQNKTQFGTPETRNVNLILTKTEEEAKQAKQEIESGKPFAEVAKAKSIDPISKAKGGEVKEIVKGQESKALSEAIFSAPVNQLSGPVKTPFGYYIYEVTAVKPGTQQPLKSVEKRIKLQLGVAKEQKALAKFTKEFAEHWKEQTDCAEGFVVPSCKQYTAPKTA